jgi:hypothetical protein
MNAMENDCRTHFYGFPLAVSNDGMKYVFGEIKKNVRDPTIIDSVVISVLELNIP